MIKLTGYDETPDAPLDDDSVDAQIEDDDVDSGEKNSPTSTEDTSANEEFTNNNSTTNFSTEAENSQSPVKNSADDEYQRKIAAQIVDDIANAQRHIDDLPESDLRGIPKDFLRRWKCGFAAKWRHPKKSITKIPTPRVLFPLGAEDDKPAYNAVMTNSGRKCFAGYKPKDKYDKTAEKCLSAGSKPVFNPDALNAEIVPVTEGEWDALSLMFATNERVKVCALGGAGIYSDLQSRLQLKPGEQYPKIVVLFDKDAESQAGQNLSKDLLKRLSDMGVVAVERFFDDFMTDDQKEIVGEKADANAILQKCGAQVLNDLIEKIIDSAREEFPAAEEKIKQQDIFRAASGGDKKSKTAPVVTDETKKIARDALITIPAEKISEPEWTKVIWAGIASGLSREELEKWARGKRNYDATHFADVFNRYDENWKNGKKEPRKLTVASLIEIAQKFGFKPPKKYDAENIDALDIPDDLKQKIHTWEKAQLGTIDASWVVKWLASTKKIDAITEFTAELLSDIELQKALGQMKFYSFFAPTRDRFFTQLRDAKAAAKRKISAWNKDNTLTAPTDDAKFLSTFDIRKFEREVDKHYTQCKKEWEAFVRVARQKAAQENYDENAPTTRKIIPDCPADLLIPHEIFFTEKTCGTQMLTDRGETITRIAARNPVVVTRRFSAQATGKVEYEIAIRVAGVWKFHSVDGRALQSARGVDTLADYGLCIDDASQLAKYFARLIAANVDRIPEIVQYSRPGWHGDKFIYPTPADGENYVVTRAGYNFAADFAENGDADEWRKMFAEAMRSGGHIARMFVGVAVAAPLVKKIGIHNLQVHIYGQINAGKTVLERLAASIYGNPQELIKTFESSPKRRQADAAANCDMPVFLDELETVRGQKAEQALTQSVYAYFAGVGNQNLHRDGSARDTFKFAGSRLSTGERQILKIADQFGAYKRLLQLKCSRKLFDKNFATELYNFTEINFGHFGRAWTNYVAENAGEIGRKFKACAKIILTNGDREETLLRTICAAGVAYQFFAQCIGLQDEFDDSAFYDDVPATIDNLPKVTEMSDSARAIAALKDFVAGHENNFYRETANVTGKEYEPRSYNENYGKLYLDGAVAFYKESLKQILSKLQFSAPDMLISTWLEENKLLTNEGSDTRRVRINGGRKYVIYFKAGVLSEERDDTTPLATPLDDDDNQSD